VPISTTGLTALVGGEDWHYVGEAGEADWYDPGSGDAWANNQANFQLAYRLRESGIVDIQGIVAASADPPSAVTIFTLPVGYRPSANSYFTASGLTTGAKFVSLEVVVDTNGLVGVVDGNVDPFPAPGNTDALDRVTIAAQVFLNPADAP
jgi:hypothetical protein